MSQPVLEPFQERVVAELAELDSRIMKLDDFIGRSDRPDLHPGELERMGAQLGAMRVLSWILGERIKYFHR